MTCESALQFISLRRFSLVVQHSIPSGGDWTLARSAVLFFEGTERSKVEGCVFERTDGNAILLSAYNRNVTIVENEVLYG